MDEWLSNQEIDWFHIRKGIYLNENLIIIIFLINNYLKQQKIINLFSQIAKTNLS